MNGSRHAGANRRTHTGTIAALALLTHGALAFAQGAVTAGAQPAKVMVTTKDSSRSEFVLIGTFGPRVDSLIKRLNTVPIGSPEYRATDDSLRIALRSMPRPMTAQGEFSISIKSGPRATLRTTAMDVIPAGWFGFTADGINEPWYEPAGAMIRHLEYPTVVAIEANSPASRAGVRPGDSLLAYDGKDLRRYPINLTRLLEPGHEVSIRLRRDGESKDVNLLVEKAPPAVMAERRAAVAGTMITTPGMPFPADSMERRLVEMRAAENQVMAAAPVRGGQLAPTRAAAGARGGGGGGGFMPSAPAAVMGQPSGVLGAAMTNIDPDMAESILGMKGKHGVFVTTVPAGSIAERTGLRAGDVILRIEAGDVSTVAHLRARLVYAQMNNVEKIRVTIMRKGKTEDLIYDQR